MSRYDPVGSNVILYSEAPISSVCRHTPVAASQILTVRSSEADATCRESCEKATELTQSLWPSSVCRHTPVAASQILTVRSSEADATCRESCEKATELTQLAMALERLQTHARRRVPDLDCAIARGRRELP